MEAVSSVDWTNIADFVNYCLLTKAKDATLVWEGMKVTFSADETGFNLDIERL